MGVWLALSYFVGAIPTSYLAARWGRGIDLREVGSRNLGATNLFRLMGWRYAIPVALFDMGKGIVPVAWFGRMAAHGEMFALLLGLVAVLGHAFSIFVGFRGGKGVATGAGVLLALVPGGFAVALGVWAVTLWITGYVSLASMVAAACYPVAGYVLYPEHRTTLWLQVGLAGIIIFLHRANIARLIHGTEHRFRTGERGSHTA